VIVESNTIRSNICLRLVFEMFRASNNNNNNLLCFIDNTIFFKPNELHPFRIDLKSIIQKKTHDNIYMCKLVGTLTGPSRNFHISRYTYTRRYSLNIRWDIVFVFGALQIAWKQTVVLIELYSMRFGFSACFTYSNDYNGVLGDIWKR